VAAARPRSPGAPKRSRGCWAHSSSRYVAPSRCVCWAAVNLRIISCLCTDERSQHQEEGPDLHPRLQSVPHKWTSLPEVVRAALLAFIVYSLIVCALLTRLLSCVH
jgi:hypothetical protein